MSAGMHEKIDLNRVGVEQLKAVRGIGRSRAEEIVRYRGKKGPFTSLDELNRVPHVGDMPPSELRELKTRFTLGGGDAARAAPGEHPKVDVNAANIEELRAVEGIGFERAQEIVRYREEHGAIRDLGELDALPHFRDEPDGQRRPIKARLKV